MNSRQRRKLAAARHNALRLEEEAYREDRVRDPDKYNWRVKRKGSLEAALLVAGVLQQHRTTQGETHEH